MNVFLPANILVPQIDEIEKWSVVACDQFTSEPEYWEDVRAYVGDAPSAVNLNLPEAELENDQKKQIQQINRCMEQYVSNNLFTEYRNSYIYVERTLKNGKIRKGVVGMIDLESYDYERNSTSYIRATEETVIERIPPRVAIRREATLELPHILLFCDNSEKDLIEVLENDKHNMQKIYELDLMKDGGHIIGWLVRGAQAIEFEKQLQKYVKTVIDKYEIMAQKPMLFAVGDGNHSLATAKACYEEMKKNNPDIDWSNHPARYALVELENIHDDAQEFEPIHRIIRQVDVCKLLSEMKNTICSDKGIPIIYYCGEEKGVLHIDEQLGELTVGVLQTFLDEYLEKNCGKIDYIHGEDVLEKLARTNNSIGFVLPTIDKKQLFWGIVKDGVLPRKTFSMGHAQEKRYYLEARKIRG